jgi:TetR/AcrR family transcriptional regulator, regulator of biofilm formation and stress response
MATSRARGEATRAAILRATAELIAEAGWAGFGTREIATRAGVTQGVVGYHWRSKDDLLRDAALAAAAESLEPVVAALREGPTVRRALERAIALIEAVRQEPPLTLLLFETMLNAARDERLRRELAAMLRDFRTTLAAALAAEGAADSGTLAATLSAAFDGLLLHAVVDETLDLAQAARPLLSLLDPPPPARGRRHAMPG